MPDYTIVGGAPTAEFEVHAAGCRDLKQPKYQLCNMWTLDADSAEALVDEEVQVYTDQDQGWSHDDHRIMPCAQPKPSLWHWQCQHKNCGKSLRTEVRLAEAPQCSGRYIKPSGSIGHLHKGILPMELVNTTEGTTTMATTETTTSKPKKAAAPENECQCFAVPVEGQPGVYESCGRLTKGRFAPGHDAKLKGLLIRHAVEGTKYKVVQPNGKNKNFDPIKVAAEMGWSKFVDRGMEVAAEKKAAAEAKAAEKAAAKADKTAAQDAAKEAKAAKAAEAKAAKAEKAAAAKAAKAAKAAAAKAAKAEEVEAAAAPEGDDDGLM